MEANFRLLWKALVNAYDTGWELVLINLMWFVLSVPIITLPATMAGLAYYMHELSHGESVSWKDFFVGIRKFFWPSMRFLLANLFIFFVLLFYHIYFTALHNNFTPLVIGLIYGIALIWLLLAPFIFPLMIEQKKPGLRSALRNSLVMYVKWPGITLLVVILIYILVLGSTYFIIPWAIISASLCSYLLAYLVMAKTEESLQLQRTQEENKVEGK